MIQYNTKDIIDKALALADLQNSDFLTWKEKITMLNDSYVNMYNKAIDYGDNIFTEEVEILDTDTELPNDFYQLREVYIVNNNIKTLVTPKPMNQSYGSLSYEIVNNTLRLYGKYQGKAYYTYYVNPQTLVLAREKKELDLEINIDDRYPIIASENLFANGDWYFYDNKQKNFWDSTKEKEVSYSIIEQAPSENFFKFYDKKTVLTLWNRSAAPIMTVGKIFSNSTKYGSYTFQQSGNYFSIAYYSGEWYFVNAGGNELYSMSIGNDSLEVGSLAYTLDFNIKRVGHYSADIIYFPYDLSEDTMISFNTYTKDYCIGNGDFHNISDFLNFNETINLFYLNPSDKTFSDSIVFVTSQNRMFFINNDNEEPNLFKEIDRDLDLLAISDFDPNTCYGLICYDSAEEKIYMESAFDDTELTFPNNTYFTLIAYQLAILFCNKQGKDNTALRIELEKQENIFYDSLHRDETSFRITNVDSYN